MSDRRFRIAEYIRAATVLLDKKGDVYLNEGETARIMVYDPDKHATTPYGLRKEGEHITLNFFADEQLAKNPDYPEPKDVWSDNPGERYDPSGYYFPAA